MELSRRQFLEVSAATAAAGLLPPVLEADAEPQSFLSEVAYADVTITSPAHLAQIENTTAVLLDLPTDSLLKPFRAMSGQPAPGATLGGWYLYNPDYNFRKEDAGLAPSATFGQWVSALARHYAATGDRRARERVLELNRLYAETITPLYYQRNRFPAYCYDKLVCDLMDAHHLAGDPDALRLLEITTNIALPELPGRAVDREVSWRPGKDQSWNWDESYTMPENLYLVSTLGAGPRYRALADQYLLESYFDPLARGENVLGGRHAYSYVNALCSAMQAYMVAGSRKHLDAARNGFDFLEQQSFATGGWGPDELLRHPGSGDVFASLTKSHNSFETPCGSYAHMKLTRYLLRVTRDGRYGDSMERVMYNTVLGAKPLQPDGHAFYYSDYNFEGKRVFSDHRWPCCSGTLPQVAADYGINSYFRDGNALWVNLYIPSTVRWTSGEGSHIELTQEGDYPLQPEIRFRLTASSPSGFTLHLRIPAWAESPSLTMNGRPVPLAVQTGFASIHRTWTSGDQITLRLPASPRLEPIDPKHPEVAAVVQGPLVLFPLAPVPASVTRKAALAMQHTGPAEWTLSAASGPVRLVPFTAVGDSPYTTYLQLA